MVNKTKMKSFSFLPLYIIDDDNILVYKYGSLYIFNYNTESLTFIAKLPIPNWKKIGMRNKLFCRFFRLINMICEKFDEKYYLFYDSNIYCCDILNKTIQTVGIVDRGRRPLNTLAVSDSNVFTSGIYYGDYCGNSAKEPINIYRIEKDNKKKIVFTFEKGLINHVHNLLYDKSNNRIYIFTGDFGEAASIWYTDDDFKTVRLLAGGSQQYRSCVASIINNGSIIYPTDSPLEPNSVILYNPGNGFTKTLINPINGSAIYGIQIGDNLYFSSAVEPSGIYKNKMESLLSKKRGPGILTNQIFIYQFSLESFEIKKIYENYKDGFPYATFQFGTINFPKGIWNRNVLPSYQIATKKHDLKTLFISGI